MAEASRIIRLAYTGEERPSPGQKDERGQPIHPYLPDEGLREAVNLAILLERPLLIKGEPGCGKTRLAAAVAYEFGVRYKGGEGWPYYACPIKSTSRARDLFYTYDTVRQLREAQLAATGRLSPKQIEGLDDPERYVVYRELGQAFHCTERAVVLLDEIDKADTDFPNDLLWELEDYAFRVEETDKTVFASKVPILFITSNDEKDLPDAFLRRCLFHFIEFPKELRLQEIVNAHYPGLRADLVKKAVVKFVALRDEAKAGQWCDPGGRPYKVPSTSELLDWVKVIQTRHSSAEALEKLDSKDVPYPGTLGKR